MPSQNFIGVSEARDRFKDLVEGLEERDVVVLRHNRPVAMMVHPDKLERLISKIEDLEDENAILRYKLEGDELIVDDELDDKSDPVGAGRQADTARGVII